MKCSCLFLILMLIKFSVNAQKYVPLVKDGVVWNE